MKNMFALAGIALALVATPADARMSDAQVRQKIIDQSIAAYPGSCPCPYNSASNGSRCGKRSAWSRGGGYSPKCYKSDVSDAEVKAWRSRHG